MCMSMIDTIWGIVCEYENYYIAGPYVSMKNYYIGVQYTPIGVHYPVKNSLSF